MHTYELTELIEKIHNLSGRIHIPGEFELFDCKFRTKGDGVVEIYDADKKKWMTTTEYIEKKYKKLLDAIFKDDEEDEEPDCKTCEHRNECDVANKDVDDCGDHDDCEGCCGDETDSETIEIVLGDIEEYGKIVDVTVEGSDVICKFANGEVHKAICDPLDTYKWSLDTGIAICLGKFFAGGSNKFNRMVHQGMKVYLDDVKAEEREYERQVEEERIRKNKEEKRKRYLKKRAERKRRQAEQRRPYVYANGRIYYLDETDTSEVLEILAKMIL